MGGGSLAQIAPMSASDGTTMCGHAVYGAETRRKAREKKKVLSQWSFIYTHERA
jgi:hypothetical protein